MNRAGNNALHQSQALSTAPSKIQLITPKFHHLMPPVQAFRHVREFSIVFLRHVRKCSSRISVPLLHKIVCCENLAI